jgi:hypothetical protein
LNKKTKILNEKILTDVGSVYKGIEYYRVLLEYLPPGSVPDIAFMSTFLELVRFEFGAGISVRLQTFEFAGSTISIQSGYSARNGLFCEPLQSQRLARMDKNEHWLM